MDRLKTLHSQADPPRSVWISQASSWHSKLNPFSLTTVITTDVQESLSKFLMNTGGGVGGSGGLG